MADISGGSEVEEPIWTEDSNSPQDVSSSNSYTIGDTGHDEYLVVMEEVEDNGSSPQLQINGNTGSNYYYIDSNGNNTESASSIRLSSPSTAGMVGELLLGHNNRGVLVSAMMAIDSTNTGRNVLDWGYYNEYPFDDTIDSFKLLNCNNGTIRVYWRDV